MIKLKADLKMFLETSKCKLGLEIAKRKLEKVEEDIAENIADRNAKVIQEQVKVLNTIHGKFSQLGL